MSKVGEGHVRKKMETRKEGCEVVVDGKRNDFRC